MKITITKDFATAEEAMAFLERIGAASPPVVQGAIGILGSGPILPGAQRYEAQCEMVRAAGRK